MAKTAQEYTDERYAGYRGEAEQLREQRRQSDDAAIQQYNEAADRTAAAAKKPYESQLEELPGEYQKMLDYNALQELIGQRQAAESMANLGLTDSGLNRTQQTALAVQRGNADNEVRLAQQQKTEELQAMIDQITANSEAQKIQQEAAVRNESDSWYNNLLADFYSQASQEGTALYDADKTRAAQAQEYERQRQVALEQYEIQQRQEAERAKQETVRRRVIQSPSRLEAQIYLDDLIHDGSIGSDEGREIYRSVFGSEIEEVTYERVAAAIGQDKVLPESEYQQLQLGSQYTDYQDYLRDMYWKAKQ